MKRPRCSAITKAQTFMRIILPQVIKRILPPVTNEVITLIKDTSLAFAIGEFEMFTTARAIRRRVNGDPILLRESFITFLIIS